MNKWNDPIKFAVNYYRLSEDGTIETQMAQIRDYCKGHGILVHKEFIDDGVSGGSFNRPGWKSLEFYLKENHKQIHYVVMRDVQRFGRTDFINSMSIRNELQIKYDIKILSIKDNPDININDINVKLLQTFESYFAQKERDEIRKRTRDKIAEARKMGYFISLAPYGYKSVKNAGDKYALLVVDDEKAKIVRQCFEMALRGTSFVEIYQFMKNEGKGFKSKESVARLLKNTVYAGWVHTPHNKNDLIKGVHEPIVSQYLFDCVQVKIFRKNPAKQRKDEMYLNGYLYTINSTLFSTSRSRGKSGKKYSYYVCNKHKINLLASRAHEKFEAILKEFTFSKEEADWYKQEVKSMIEQEDEGRELRFAEIKKKLDDLNKKIAGAERKYLMSEDVVSESSYKLIINELTGQRNNYTAQLQSLASTKDEYFASVETIFNSLTNLHGWFMLADVEAKHQLISLVFGGILTYDNGIYRTPYLSDLFVHKSLVLKEKGLLITGNLFEENRENSLGVGKGSIVEHLMRLGRLWAA